MACPTGKRQFTTIELAQKSSKIRDRKTGRVKRLYAYYCPRCQQYHLTSLSPRQRYKTKKRSRT